MSERPRITRAVTVWLLGAVLVSLPLGAVEVAVQQDMRGAADEQQTQAATDAVLRLDAGAPLTQIVGSTDVDIARSLNTHVSVYDRTGKLIASTARLDGAVPEPPSGVLQVARDTGRNRVTWQPRSGVRVAAVALPWRGGTVLAGRSLATVEERESNLAETMVVLWIGSLVASGGIAFVVSHLLDAGG